MSYSNFLYLNKHRFHFISFLEIDENGSAESMTKQYDKVKDNGPSVKYRRCVIIRTIMQNKKPRLHNQQSHFKMVRSCWGHDL